MRVARHVPTGRTGDAEVEAPCPALLGPWTSDVACGSWHPGRTSLADLGSSTEGRGVWGGCFRLAFSLAELNYSTLCVPAPRGNMPPSSRIGALIKPTISASASRSNLWLLSEICCFPPSAASWQQFLSSVLHLQFEHSVQWCSFHASCSFTAPVDRHWGSSGDLWPFRGALPLLPLVNSPRVILACWIDKPSLDFLS